MDTNQKPNTHRQDQDTIELYQYIYKNAQMGMGSIGKLLEFENCKEIDDILHGQRKGYTAIMRDAGNALAERGIKPVGMRAPEKLHTCFMLRSATLKKEGSLSRIAGMVIFGTTMGSIEGSKKKSSCRHASDDSKALMERLLRFEEANCRRLRSFL